MAIMGSQGADIIRPTGDGAGAAPKRGFIAIHIQAWGRAGVFKFDVVNCTYRVHDFRRFLHLRFFPDRVDPSPPISDNLTQIFAQLRNQFDREIG